MKKLCLILAAIVFAVFVGCAPRIPSPSYENGGDDGYFTGMWVATVSGLDFTGVERSVSKQKSALSEIVKTAERCGFDAILFQVRPEADAFYSSEIFPRSRWAGEGDFDQLAYLCKLAAKADIEVHAWINPYRVCATPDMTPPAGSIAARFPDMVIRAGDGKLYLDPGNPDSITLVADGVKEILDNYPVSGVVFDDYFYPANVEFDDSASFKKYGGGLSLEDWRRSNTYALVERISTLVGGYEGKVFGVSPIGIWQNESSDPRGSNTQGLESYKALYADTYKWVQDGIVDYVAPQIYWEHGHKLCDFKVVAKWWNDAVKGTDVALFITHGVYRVTDGAFDKGEIARQLDTLAGLSSVKGSFFYRYRDIPALQEYFGQCFGS